MSTRKRQGRGGQRSTVQARAATVAAAAPVPVVEPVAVAAMTVLEPARVRSASPEQRKCVDELRVASVAAAEAQLRLVECVERARASGLSWASVGWSVGTSGEAARQRYGAGGS